MTRSPLHRPRLPGRARPRRRPGELGSNRRRVHPGAVTVVLVLGLTATATTSGAGWRPSTELSFRVQLGRDSILIGDPIPLRVEASGPEGAALVLPDLTDSLGAFRVLEANPVKRTTGSGRLQLSQDATITLFKSGPDTLPALSLLWVPREGDTLVAWSEPREVRVGTLLEGEADLSKLRDLKGVVRLGLPDWVYWTGGGLLVLALLFVAWRLARRRGTALPATNASPVPADPPEVAFEKGLRDLLARSLPEKGLIKEFYVEVSYLLRRYLEDRFGFPAVEETRTEVLARTVEIPVIGETEQVALIDWLDEGDLVKFAKFDRRLEEAHGYAARAREWVRTVDARARATAPGSPGSDEGPAFPGSREAETPVPAGEERS